MHLAAHFGVPVVALFGPTDPARNGPYGTRSTVLRNANSKTSYSHTAEAHEGLMGVSTDEVVRPRRSCWSQKNSGRRGRLNWSRVARRIRVPLGFVFAALFLWLAHPTWTSIFVGAVVAASGVCLRAAASGHVRKNAELTTTGPYAYTRNPFIWDRFLSLADFASRHEVGWLSSSVSSYSLRSIFPSSARKNSFCALNFWDSMIIVSACLACSRDCGPHLERHGAAFRGHYIYSIASTMLPWAPPQCWERWWPSCCGYNAKSQERHALPPSGNHRIHLDHRCWPRSPWRRSTMMREQSHRMPAPPFRFNLRPPITLSRTTRHTFTAPTGASGLGHGFVNHDARYSFGDREFHGLRVDALPGARSLSVHL